MLLTIPEDLLDSLILKKVPRDANLNCLFSRYYNLMEKSIVDKSSRRLIHWLVTKGLCKLKKSKGKVRYSIKDPQQYLYNIFDNVFNYAPKSNSTDSIPKSFYEKILNCSDKDQLTLLYKNHLKVLKACPRRARLGFSLTLTDLRKLYSRKTCYYTGVRFSLNKSSLLPTLDRVDNTKGYVRGNVVLCTSQANSFKSILFEGSHSVLKTDLKSLSTFIRNYERALQKGESNGK